ncbi:MAG: hypothetical protein QS748_06085 [Candidatus Endonucleobacter bathymodioli]|uniref:Uncharacterized protein n=1 Tax=Candidatus Endonucleibacter bathymodioli TaxID=539814 RepID=A0AA90NL74_9GAMM|nr:hypothetical protein [Candidatus Endonucleobacter bathymodioli]
MKKNILFITTICSLLVSLLTSCHRPISHKSTTDVIFISYDQGESNAFIQIEKQLIKNNITYKILAIGSSSTIFANHPDKIELSTFNSQDALNRDRTKRLPDNIISQVTSTYRAHIIYSGMASTAQAQLINSFGQQGSYTIAFYDNFDDPAQQQYLRPFIDETSPLDELHVPSNAIRNSFLTFPKLNQSNIIVTGQPALEGRDEVYRKTDTAEIRQQLKLGPVEPVILFAGGYDHDYEASFKVFIEATKKLPNIKFIVTHHPKHDGQLEGDIIKKYNCRNVLLIQKGEWTTPMLSKVAVAIATHKSTVGALAIYKRKPVIYIADNGYSNFLIDAGLATKASTPEKAAKALSMAISSPAPSLKSLGMPDFPAQVIATIIKSKLQYYVPLMHKLKYTVLVGITTKE